MKFLRYLLIVCVIACSPAAAIASPSWHLPRMPWQAQKAAQQRIVCLGDSITDGGTYELLVAQALFDANKPVPIITNAGVGGDTIANMRARLDKDVIAYHPDLVTISAGAGDAAKGVGVDAFEADLDAILDRLDAEQIKVILLTTSIDGPKFASLDGTLAGYNEIIHEDGAQRHIPVAEVSALMREAQARGLSVLEADNTPTFEGQRTIARALLDAMGYPDVTVPTELKPLMMPGVIAEWKIRLAPSGQTLMRADVAALKPDSTWTSYTLPDPAQASGWLDQERQLGYAVNVDKALGVQQDTLLDGFAIVNNYDHSTKQVYFNTGAQLQSVWVNGVKIFQSLGWTGWHAGKERVAAELSPGANIVVIESNGPFFLSVTDTNTW